MQLFGDIYACIYLVSYDNSRNIQHLDAEINAASNTGTILSASNNAGSNTFICMAASNNFVPFAIDFDEYIKFYTIGVKCDIANLATKSA